MSLRYRRSILLSAMLGVLVCYAPASWSQSPGDNFFDLTLGDFRDELETAREEGKKGILLYFEMDSCPFCQRMKNHVFSREDVQKFYKKNFLIFAINIESDEEITDFQGKTMSMKKFAFINRVRATPVFIFYDLKGKPVTRYIGATAGVDEFMWLGEYVAEKAYEKMPFVRYKRMKKKAAKKSS